MLILLEGIALCFCLLLTCTIGIANGPVGLVVLYENDVQERAISLGLTTRKQIKRSFILSCIAMFVPVLVFTPLMVYLINGARGFLDPFLQMTAITLMQGLFDRLFIDLYWVGHTKAWYIEGTEDLMPYIPKKIMLGKWLATLVLFPALMALISYIMTLIL